LRNILNIFIITYTVLQHGGGAYQPSFCITGGDLHHPNKNVNIS